MRADEGYPLIMLCGQSNMTLLPSRMVFTPLIREMFPRAVIVKSTAVGLPISNWLAGRQSARLAGKVERALRGRPPPSVLVFCWMHGESDAKLGVPGYADALAALEDEIEILRGGLGLSDVPLLFVLGRLGRHKVGEPGWDAVRQAQIDFATGADNRAWIDTDDLGLGLHYGPGAHIHLAFRFAGQVLEMLQQQVVN